MNLMQQMSYDFAVVVQMLLVVVHNSVVSSSLPAVILCICSQLTSHDVPTCSRWLKVFRALKKSNLKMNVFHNFGASIRPLKRS